MQRLALGCVVFLSLLAGAAHAQPAPSIVTAVDRKKVELGDDVELSISVAGQYEEFIQPTIDDFDVVSQGVQQVISGRQRSVTRNFTLRPKKSGNLTIGAARLTIGGRTVSEAPAIIVQVVEPKAPDPIDAAAAADLQRMSGEAAFIRYATPRTRYYVGEPFPMTLELWLQEGLGYAGAELVRAPKFDGLLVEDLAREPNARPKVRRIGDTRYQVYELGTVLATPLKAGSVLVDAATLRIAVSTDGWSFSAKKDTRSTQPFNLEVRDLPANGRPASFRSGNVGNFTMKVKLSDDRGQEPARAKTGQRMVLRAEVAGRGNLVALEAPAVVAPAGFEVTPLPGSGEDQVSKDVDGVQGTRVFQWLVVAKTPGQLSTPDVSLGWWNPEAERYDEAKAGGRAIEVTGAAVDDEANDALSFGEDVGPIETSATLSGKRPTPPAASPIYWGLVALPVCGWLFVEWRWRRRRADAKHPGQRLSRGAAANAKKRLRAAEQALRDGLVKDFYGQLARTLTSYLEERANIPATGMTHDQVRAAAGRSGYPSELVDAVVVEMENCDFARFAPAGSAAEKMREAHVRVSELVGRLDRVQPERRP